MMLPFIIKPHGGTEKIKRAPRVRVRVQIIAVEQNSGATTRDLGEFSPGIRFVCSPLSPVFVFCLALLYDSVGLGGREGGGSFFTGALLLQQTSTSASRPRVPSGPPAWTRSTGTAASARQTGLDRIATKVQKKKGDIACYIHIKYKIL